MDRAATLFYPIFLCFVCSQALAGLVTPPTNVSLQCRNLRNVLTWSYDEPLTPGLRFHISIGCITDCQRNLWVEPPALQADLSFLSQPGNDYNVHVSAVIGKDESGPAPSDGIEFSYFMDSIVERKCVLDLPPVTVSAQKDEVVLLRFVHPWLFHQQKLVDSPNYKSNKKRRHQPENDEELPEFKYHVVLMDQREQPHDLSCVDEVCEQTVPVNASQPRHCLKITGQTNQVSVESTEEYCAPQFVKPSDQNALIPIIVVVVLLLIAVVIIFLMVYRKKTKPTTPIPDSMHITDNRKPLTFTNHPEPVIVLEPESPTPLLQDTPDTPEETSVTVSEPEWRLPIGVSTEPEGVCQDVENPYEKRPEYMQGGQLEDDNADHEEISAYEKRVVLVQVAPGEQVEGYRS